MCTKYCRYKEDIKIKGESYRTLGHLSYGLNEGQLSLPAGQGEDSDEEWEQHTERMKAQQGDHTY